MTNGFIAPVNAFTSDAASSAGPLDTWRHAPGHGSINMPLPSSSPPSITRTGAPTMSSNGNGLSARTEGCPFSLLVLASTTSSFA